jgi:hypothetical protein
MVDFTKAVNNEQMVEALNDLIDLNYDVMTGYDKALEKNSGLRSRLGELRDMHDRHIRQLAESVRILGGAPVEGGSGHGRGSPGKTLLAGMGKKKEGSLALMQSNEEKLKEAYIRTVDQYRASDEIVEVVNQVLDDGRELRTWLEQEAGKS